MWTRCLKRWWNFCSFWFFKEKKKSLKYFKMTDGWMIGLASEILYGLEDLQAELRVGYFVFIVNALFLFAEM